MCIDIQAQQRVAYKQQKQINKEKGITALLKIKRCKHQIANIKIDSKENTYHRSPVYGTAHGQFVLREYDHGDE
jgi:hypothetical protein